MLWNSVIVFQKCAREGRAHKLTDAGITSFLKDWEATGQKIV